MKMSKYAEEHGFGKATVTFRLKDWGISRQRYWGTPIPMIYCATCGVVPVPGRASCRCCCRRTWRSRWPADRRWTTCPEFVNVKCPKCGGDGAPRDRHDGHVRRFVLVLLSLHQSAARHRARSTPKTVDYWFPIDQYIGGVEHAILHLIYSRFWTKVMRDMGLVHNRRAGRAPVHAGHGDQGRRQDVEEPGQRRVARRHGGAIRRRLRRACTRSSPRLRTAIWIGRMRASKASAASCRACTG